jgi:hypothetical protein
VGEISADVIWERKKEKGEEIKEENMKEKNKIKVIGKIEVKRVNKCKKSKNKAKRGSEK